MQNKNSLENKMRLDEAKGITLLALVITIVVIIILATIAINYAFGDNGIINSAKYSKDRTEISTEKEQVDTAALAALYASEWEDITYEGLDEQLKINIGEGKYVLEGNGPFSVIYVDSRRSYGVDRNGKVTEEGTIVEDKYPGDITKDEEGNELDGSQEHPYEIWCIEDLMAFSNMTNGNGIKIEAGKAVEVTKVDRFIGKYVSLKRNLDFKSTMSYSDSKRTDFGDINGNAEDGNTLINEMTTHMGFRPIKAFAGTFDGESHSLNNIYINYKDYMEENKEAALFVGVNATTTIIQNITVTGEIKSNWHAAGILSGNNVYKIENCINYANITGNNMVGGICGIIRTSTNGIKNCINYGNLTITGKSYQYAGIGGIVGCCQAGDIVNCVNNGEINSIIGDINSGGIVGCAKNVNINDCYNTADLKIGNAGGIVGTINNGINEISNSRNLGKCYSGIVNYYGRSRMGCYIKFKYKKLL